MSYTILAELARTSTPKSGLTKSDVWHRFRRSWADTMQIVRVALDVPLHRFFDYLAPEDETLTPADVGLRVRVLWQRSRIGIVVELPEASGFSTAQLKSIEAVLRDLPALPDDWFRLSEFCAAYYQSPLGDVMLSTLPAGLRRLDPPKARSSRPSKLPPPLDPPSLTAEQQAALDGNSARAWAFTPTCCTVRHWQRQDRGLSALGRARGRRPASPAARSWKSTWTQLETCVAARFPRPPAWSACTAS